LLLEGGTALVKKNDCSFFFETERNQLILSQDLKILNADLGSLKIMKGFVSLKDVLKL
jgi:hypothetical protein